MTDQEQVKHSLQMLTGADKKAAMSCEACIVKSIEENTCTLTSILSEIKYDKVNLQSYNDAKSGIVITPKIDSMVIMISMDECNRFVVLCSEIERIQVAIEETTLTIDKDEIVLNKGDHGGLCITPTLVENLKKLSTRVDGIIDAINNAVAVPQDGGVGLQKTMSISLATLVDKEDFSQIENDKIKH